MTSAADPQVEIVSSRPAGEPLDDDLRVLPATPGEWTTLLDLIPGYDPFSNSGDGDYFDPSIALDALRFFHEFQCHIEGAVARTPFVLERWQQSVIANLFGWLRDNGTRRYREVLLYVPRKNGKTPLCAGIANYVMFMDGEVGGQAYCAAADREQASLMYRHAWGMIEQDAHLAARCDHYKASKTVIHKESGSYFKVLSAVADTKHGGNPHLVIVDELHAQPNRELVDVLATSMASQNRLQPLTLYATTADVFRPSVCNEKRDYAIKVRDGVADDRAFLPVVYEAEYGSDWRSEEVWEAANPNLDISVSRDYLRRECEKAQVSPELENTFKRLHLNMRTEQINRWMQMDLWHKCDRGPASDVPIYTDALLGQRCWGGLDLSTVTDLSSLVLAFPVDDTESDLVLLGFHWLPAESVEIRSRRDRAPYSAWAASDQITVCDGGTIDYPAIRAAINDICGRYDVREIAVDLFNARSFADDLLNEDGLPVIEHRQTFGSYNEPCKEFQRLVASGRLAHMGDPVLSWAVGNLVVIRNQTGLIMPAKGKSFERIDPAVAAIMAVGRAMFGKSAADDDSIYETRGLLEI